LGYVLLAANLRLPGGEIDLLAIDGDTLVVVEVRSTQSNRPEALAEIAASVDQRKQEKLTRAALAFLARYRALGQVPLRFDVIAVAWPPHSRHPLIHHIPNAFPAQGRYQFFC
jgi:putative endonuclease